MLNTLEFDDGFCIVEMNEIENNNQDKKNEETLLNINLQKVIYLEKNCDEIDKSGLEEHGCTVPTVFHNIKEVSRESNNEENINERIVYVEGICSEKSVNSIKTLLANSRFGGPIDNYIFDEYNQTLKLVFNQTVVAKKVLLKSGIQLGKINYKIVKNTPDYNRTIYVHKIYEENMVDFIVTTIEEKFGSIEIYDLDINTNILKVVMDKYKDTQQLLKMPFLDIEDNIYRITKSSVNIDEISVNEKRVLNDKNKLESTYIDLKNNENVLKRTIYITKIPEENYIRIIKNRLDSHIESFEYDKTTKSLKVILYRIEDALKLLNLGKFEIGRNVFPILKTFQIAIGADDSSEPYDKIETNNFNMDASDDDSTLYLWNIPKETTAKSLYYIIKNLLIKRDSNFELDFNEGSRDARVTYESKDEANNLLKKEVIYIDDAIIKITSFFNKFELIDDSKLEKFVHLTKISNYSEFQLPYGEFKTTDPSVIKLRISKIPIIMSEQILNDWIFSNMNCKKILSVDYKQGNGDAEVLIEHPQRILNSNRPNILKYKDNPIMVNVIEFNKNKELENKSDDNLKEKIDFKELHQTKFNAIAVEGIPQSSNEDFLSLYFASSRNKGGPLKDFYYDPDLGTCRLVYEDENDAESILHHKHEGKAFKLTPLEYPYSNEDVLTLVTSDILTNFAIDYIQLYMEKLVECECEVFMDFDNKLTYITFENTTARDSVINAALSISGTSFVLKKLKPAPPPKLILMDIDELVFIARNLSCKINYKEFSKYMDKITGPAQLQKWQQSMSLTEALLFYNQPPDYQKMRKLVATKALNGKMISIGRMKHTKQIYIHFEGTLEEQHLVLTIEKFTGDNTITDINKIKNKNLVLVTFKDYNCVRKIISEPIRFNKQDLQAQTYYEEFDFQLEYVDVKKEAIEHNILKNPVNDINKIRRDLKFEEEHEIILMELTIGETQMPKSYPNVTINYNISDQCISLYGSSDDVNRLRGDIYEYMSQLEKDPSRLTISPILSRLIEMPNGKNCFYQILKNAHIAASFKLRGQEMFIYSNNSNKKNIEDLFKSSFVERITNIDPHILKISKWPYFEKSLIEDFDTLLLDKNNNYIQFACNKQVENEILQRIEEYIKINTQEKYFIPLKNGCLRFFEKFMPYEYKDIFIKHKSEEGNYLIRNIGKNSGIELIGCNELIKETRKQIEICIAKILTESKTMERPGIRDYFESNIGTLLRNSIEHGNQLIIEIVKEDEEIMESPKDELIKIYEYVLPNGSSIAVFKGDITKCQVDAIVNAANKKLDHVGGIALAIAKAAGKEMQIECKNYVAERGKILPGKCYASQPYNLKACKCIIHAVGPCWVDGTKKKKVPTATLR